MQWWLYIRRRHTRSLNFSSVIIASYCIGKQLASYVKTWVTCADKDFSCCSCRCCVLLQWFQRWVHCFNFRRWLRRSDGGFAVVDGFCESVQNGAEEKLWDQHAVAASQLFLRGTIGWLKQLQFYFGVTRLPKTAWQLRVSNDTTTRASRFDAMPNGYILFYWLSSGCGNKTVVIPVEWCVFRVNSSAFVLTR